MTRLATKTLLLPLCLISTVAVGQDVIMTSTGDEIVAKVLHVGPDAVVYRYFSDAEGPALELSRKDVAGMRLMVSADPMAAAEVYYEDEKTSIKSEQELVVQAKRDAKAYYKARGVFWTTMGATVVSPVAGLATGAVTSAVSPNINSDYNPNRHLMKEAAYREAYQKHAKRRKVGKAAAGFGAGAAILGFVYMVAASVGVGG